MGASQSCTFRAQLGHPDHFSPGYCALNRTADMIMVDVNLREGKKR
jgi:hypothetical protein